MSNKLNKKTTFIFIHSNSGTIRIRFVRESNPLIKKVVISLTKYLFKAKPLSKILLQIFLQRNLFRETFILFKKKKKKTKTVN